MKYLTIVLLVIVVILGGAVVSQFVREPTPTPVTGATRPLVGGDYLVAAPGRVEPTSEEITVGSPINGLLKQVLVKEGDHVAANQVVALLDIDQYKAQISQGEAELKWREDELRRLLNGARPEERAVAQAALDEADAQMKTAGSELERRRPLVKQGNISQEVFDRTEEAYTVARKRREAAAQRFNLINGPPRDEDVAIAKAQIELARAKRDYAQAQLEQATIRSPIEGTILRIPRHAGEIVSVLTDPVIMTIGDVSRLRVRAEVDEADIGKLQIGMPAYVTAEAYGDQRFPGRLVRKGRMLGKKNVLTDDPREHVDAKILEVLIDIEKAGDLLPGLRVNAFMLAPKTAGG
jgi:ABC exporter DevB family membrane fusion protein